MPLPTICLIRPEEGVARKAGFTWRSGLAIKHLAPELAKRGIWLTDKYVPDAAAYRFQAVGWGDMETIDHLKQWRARIVADADDHPYIWPPLPDIPIQFQQLVKQTRGNVALKGLWDEWLGKADLITTTTPALAKTLIENAPIQKPPIVLPNLIDADDFKKPRGEHIGVTILFFGSQSHLNDAMMLIDPMAAILDDFPQARFIVWGGCMPGPMEIRAKKYGERWISRDFTHYDTYHRDFMEIAPDIGLAPLEDNDFNRGRSPIKWFEYTLAGCPVIASDVDLYRPFVAHRVKTSEEWYDRIAMMIKSPLARDMELKRSLPIVMAEHSWQSLDARRPWLEFFEGLMQ